MKLDYAAYDGLGLAELVRKGDVSARELTDLAIEKIDALNPSLNAVVHKAYDAARAQADASPSGPFAGVPFLIKDLFLRVAGMPRTDGTRFSSNDPDTEDDLLTTRFREAGLVLLGKTNTPEYGITGTTEGQKLGRCRNPWNTDHISGGSSGGSASAVAAGLVPVAHASDGLGSIRGPAGCCGIVGLKTSRGRVPMGARHDREMTAGYSVHFVVSRSVRDTAAMLDVAAVPDPSDPLQKPPAEAPGAFLAATQAPPRKLRIAFSSESPFGSPIDPEVRAALEDTARHLEDLGHHVEERGLGIDYVTLWMASQAVLGAHFAGAMAERVALHGRDPQPDDIEQLTWRNWEGSKKISAEDCGRGRRVLAATVREILGFFDTYDIYLTPTLATLPPKVGVIDPVNKTPTSVDQEQAKTFFFPPPFNMSGQPGISLPLAHSTSGLPIGMLFHARYGDEATLLSLAAQLETSRPWKDRIPHVWAG